MINIPNVTKCRVSFPIVISEVIGGLVVLVWLHKRHDIYYQNVNVIDTVTHYNYRRAFKQAFSNKAFSFFLTSAYFLVKLGARLSSRCPICWIWTASGP